MVQSIEDLNCVAEKSVHFSKASTSINLTYPSVSFAALTLFATHVYFHEKYTTIPIAFKKMYTNLIQVTHIWIYDDF